MQPTISLLAMTSTFSMVLSTILVMPSNAHNPERLANGFSDTISLPQNSSKKLPQNFYVAQVFRTTYNVPAGQPIVTRLADSPTLYIGTGDSKAARLRVEQEVRGGNGTVLIPVGAIIEGEFVPIPGGSKFIARTLRSRGATVSIDADSELIHDVKDPRQTDLGAIATDAAIGAAGTSVLAAITGDRAIATEEILAGAAAGAIIGNVTAPQATVIEPNTVINLITNRDLNFSYRGN